MRKFSDLEGSEKQNLEDELESKSQLLGMDAFSSYGTTELKGLKDFIGLCANCQSLSYCKTEFDTILAKCESFKIRLNGQNKMVECNLHSPKGIMSLIEMQSIAFLIDVVKPTVKGFISTDSKLMGRPKKHKVKRNR